MNYHSVYLSSLPKLKKKSIAVIGNFDSFHKLHTSIFNDANIIANKDKINFIFITFDKTIKDFIQNNNTSITKLENKIDFLKVNYNMLSNIIEIKVDNNLLNLSPIDFINLLKNKLNVIKLVEGEDFKFGFKGSGNVELLKKEFGPENIYIKKRDNNFSTTIIKNLLSSNDINKGLELMQVPLVLKIVDEKIVFPEIKIPDGDYLFKDFDSNEYVLQIFNNKISKSIKKELILLKKIA